MHCNRDNNKMFAPNYNNRIKCEFFYNETASIARELIGKVLVRKINDSITLAGRIVETEAYLAVGDGASHSYPGLTKRNKAMFEAAGILYVYKIYGVHHCINIVTEPNNIGAAVLLRSLEPISGIDEMIRNRSITKIENLCRGPGNLAKAFGFSLENNFSSLNEPELFIDPGFLRKAEEIGQSTRIGISKSAELELRYFLKNSSYVSGKNK